MDTHDDIQSSLSQNLNSALDAELEQELEELLAEPEDQNTNNTTGGVTEEDVGASNKNVIPEEDELTRRLRALKMPIAPTESPTSSPEKIQLA